MRRFPSIAVLDTKYHSNRFDIIEAFRRDLSDELAQLKAGSMSFTNGMTKARAHRLLKEKMRRVTAASDHFEAELARRQAA